MLVAPCQREELLVANSCFLILEDDPAARSMLRRLFGGEYDLAFADDQAAALALLSRQPVDLVLLDVTAPGIDSLGVLRELRRDGVDTPVILISSLDDNSAAVKGLQAGANDYITKPLDPKIVRARVSTQIDLKRAQDEHQPTLTQLKFTQSMQENLTRIISHDLKGPLTNIRMAQFMLRDLLRGNTEVHNILDNMDVILNGMVEMLRTFLEAMDTQRLEPKLEPLEIHDLIVEVIGQYRLMADRKRIRLQMHADDVRVIADQNLLRQVLTNLVSNAVKFSQPDTETIVWAETHGDTVRICVADGGPGIPPDEQWKLFNMFGKLSTRPTGGEISTGLGLWIVKGLTELMSGQVGVDQPAEGGSVFWIELPLAAPGA